MRAVGLIALIILSCPVFVHADALININTADATLLDTLPGIGLTYATRIVDYRNAHGPFAKIEDIQNVSGIGPSTYAKIESLITVGDVDVSDPESNQVASSTPPAVATSTSVTAISHSGGPAEYLPIPTLRIITSGTRTVSSGAESAFTASVYGDKGSRRDDAIVTWSFGDGMRRNGMSVYHQYYYPGEYVAVVRASTPDGGDAMSEVSVTVKDASIKIASISSRGITLVNNDSRTLDLSLWRLSMGGKEFKIPEDTVILAGRTIIFPSQVIELPVADSASLLYPSGEVAATYPIAPVVTQVSAVEQPVVATTGYKQVQKVETIISQKTNVPSHAEAVNAPAAATGLAAAGAALPESKLETDKSVLSVFHSPWTLGLLGIMATAAAAFILL
ncbi:MAG: helix-hairpin-helix domain-containing protein [Candidatus Paceibacterota bacterium]|jgi:competence ComEA-like helix-hairpin-helix protein